MAKTIFLWITLMSFLVQPPVTNLQNPVFYDLQKPLVMVIVNSTLYTSIESNLEQYATDVANEGFSVKITETNQLQNKTPQGIRSYLHNAMNSNLVGALFVGELPKIWYEVGDRKILTDMYYKDLDGLWLDLDGDGIYDEQRGDVLPEIWLGRLEAPTIAGNEISLTKNYFTKNHRYRNGSLILPWWRSLAYIDDDGLSWADEAKLSLSQISDEVTCITDPATTNARDYESKLKDPFGYEWVYLMCHGSFDFHTFEVPKEQDPLLWDGTIFSWQYQSIDPRAFFYLFFVCSAARYTEPEYLAGSAVFTDTYGLAAIGCTDSIFSMSPLKFFTSLSEDKTIGDAFQEWILELNEKDNQLQEKDYQPIFYGLTIVGDPTLKLYRRRNVTLHDISITNVITDLKKTNNEGTLSLTVMIKNKGNFTENFNLTIYAGPYTLTKVCLSLSAKASTTVTATVPQSYRISFVNGSRTTIKVTASTIPEEFNEGDNQKYVCIQGINIISPTREFSVYPMIPIVVILIIATYGFIQMLASQRLPLLAYWMKVKKLFHKKISQ